jgi:hypothetical protein
VAPRDGRHEDHAVARLRARGGPVSFGAGGAGGSGLRGAGDGPAATSPPLVRALLTPLPPMSARSFSPQAMRGAAEMAVMSSIQHPNVVAFYSCLTDMVEASGPGEPG